MEDKSSEINNMDPVDTQSEGVQEIKPEKGLTEAREVAPPARRGRPAGSKNKDTLFKELMTGKFQDLATIQVERTIEVLFEKAHAGDMKAIKLIMDRVVPVTKAVDLADMEKKGLTINISVGNMEDAQAEGEVIEDAEWSESDE